MQHVVLLSILVFNSIQKVLTSMRQRALWRLNTAPASRARPYLAKAGYLTVHMNTAFEK